MAIPNLWGDMPEVVDIRTPKMVLAEQASLLQKITKGALTCESKVSPNGNGLVVSMRIVAPSLENYSVVLVQVAHDMFVYPCSIQSPFLGNDFICGDEAHLAECPKKYFARPKNAQVNCEFVAAN